MVLENAPRIALAYQLAEPGLHLESEVVDERAARRMVAASALFRGLVRRASTPAEARPSWAAARVPAETFVAELKRLGIR